MVICGIYVVCIDPIIDPCMSFITKEGNVTCLICTLFYVSLRRLRVASTHTKNWLILMYVCVCMHCIYVIYVCICVCTYCTCVCIVMYVCVCNLYVCMYVCTVMYVMYVCMYVCMYIEIY